MLEVSSILYHEKFRILSRSNGDHSAYSSFLFLWNFRLN